tara:strand:- start:5521 stop:6714 length:1194 start_codon:yes stop_codon:yes gene_type:complete
MAEIQALGSVERLNRRRVRGWARLEGLDEPATVIFKIGDQEIERATANIDRSKWPESAGESQGRCGFLFNVPEHLATRDLGEFSVWVAQTGTRIDIADGAVHVRVKAKKKKAKPGSEGDAAAGEPDLSLLPDMPKPPMPAPRSQWQIFRTALRALYLREVRNRYGQFRFGYVWAILQPLLFIFMINEVRSLFGGRAEFIYGVSGLYFFLIGILPFFMYQGGFHQAMGSMTSFRGIFNYRQVRPIDIIFVRCSIEFALLTLVMIIFMAGLHWLHSPIDIDNPLAFMAALGLLFIFAQGMGLVADVQITRSPDTRRIFSLIDRPLFFISGVFFTAEVIPEDLRVYLMWNPLLHAIDLGRGALLSEYESPCSWLYLSAWSIGLLMIGMGSYRRNLHLLTQ